MIIRFLVFVDALIICWVATNVIRKKIITIQIDGIKGNTNTFVWFAGYTLLTAPMFLYYVSELKYICWIYIVIWLIVKKKYIYLETNVEKWLLAWTSIVFLGIFVGGYWIRGAMMCLKYLILIFFFLIGYNVNISRDSVTCVFRYGINGVVLALIFASGMLQILAPSIYWITCSFFFGGAGLSDCFTAFAPIILYMVKIKNDKKYYYIWALCALSALLFIVRTGIGGLCVASVVYWGLQRDGRKILYSIITCICFISTFIYIDSIRNKMYSPEIQQRIDHEGLGFYLFQSDNIMDSGRTGIFESVLNSLPKKTSSFFGYGSGATNHTLRYLSQRYGTAAILHNDYRVMEIDNGKFGLILWQLFIFYIFFTVLRNIFICKYSVITNDLGIVALSSLSGVLFAMAFDNVIAHSMSSIGVSFLLLGMHFASVKKDNQNIAIV